MLIHKGLPLVRRDLTSVWYHAFPPPSWTRRTASVHILIDYRPALRQRSGAGEFIHRLALALIEHLGPDAVTLFTSSWKDRLDRRPFPGVTVADRRIPVALLNLLWHRLEWPPVERLTGRACDVVHSPHPLLTPSRRAARVVTIHDLDFLEHPERTGREIRRDYPILARSHAARADRIVVPSGFTAREVASRLEIPEDRIVRCPPGSPAWSRRPRWPDAGYVLFIGTLEPRKNLGGLISAYERLVSRNPAIPPLVIAGRATPAAQPILAALRRAPLAGMVDYRGYVPDAERRALYEGAALVVIPSLTEGFGLPALEAMSLGVPIVAANRGALPEIVGDAGLLVDPADTEALAAAIEALATDRPRAEALAERGLRRARQFTWAACASAAIEAYGGAIEHRRARAEAGASCA